MTTGLATTNYIEVILIGSKCQSNIQKTAEV